MSLHSIAVRILASLVFVRQGWAVEYTVAQAPKTARGSVAVLISPPPPPRRDGSHTPCGTPRQAGSCREGYCTGGCPQSAPHARAAEDQLAYLQGYDLPIEGATKSGDAAIRRSERCTNFHQVSA